MRWFPCSGWGFSEELRALQPLYVVLPHHPSIFKPFWQKSAGGTPQNSAERGPIGTSLQVAMPSTRHLLLDFEKRRLLWLPCPWISFLRKVRDSEGGAAPRGAVVAQRSLIDYRSSASGVELLKTPSAEFSPQNHSESCHVQTWLVSAAKEIL